MERFTALLCLLMALLPDAFTRLEIDSFNASLNGGEKYTWTQALPQGKGCWPDCAEGQWCWPRSCSHHGQWPLTIVPIEAFGKLWMIGEKSVWSSSDGLHWKQIQSNAAWGERYGMTSVLFKNRIWRMGGMEKSWDNFKNDVWYSSDGADWKLATKDAGWTPRRGHSALVYDNRLWVFGGAASSGSPDKLPSRNLNDVWYSTDGINWTRATAQAPWSGNYSSMVFRDRMWVIGEGGVWHSVDGRNWVRTVSEAQWLKRGGNNAAGCLVFDEKIWLFGGLGPNGTLNDVWQSPDGIHWQQAFKEAPWTPRDTRHSVVFNNKLWIYGGKTGREEDGYSTDVWHMTSPEAAPERSR